MTILLTNSSFLPHFSMQQNVVNDNLAKSRGQGST